MGLLNFLGILSPAHIQLVTWLSGSQIVGTDASGNRYYRASPRKGYTRERRWVMYNGEPEATKIPPEWHGWIHHQTNVIPANSGESYRRPWQKQHQANPTGTAGAYLPPGHLLKGFHRAPATGDYKAWTPDQILAKNKGSSQE